MALTGLQDTTKQKHLQDTAVRVCCMNHTSRTARYLQAMDRQLEFDNTFHLRQNIKNRAHIAVAAHQGTLCDPEPS